LAWWRKIRVIWNPIKLERTEPIKLERKKELLIKPSLLGLMKEDQSHLQSHQAWKDWAHQAWEKEGTPHQAISAWLDEGRSESSAIPSSLKGLSPSSLRERRNSSSSHLCLAWWRKIRVICNPIKLERTEPIKLERKKELLIKPSLLG
jgi:hypothetical protein